jgi:hypothetical protein
MEKGKGSERTESFFTFSIYHFPFAIASDGPAALLRAATPGLSAPLWRQHLRALSSAIRKVFPSQSMS